MPDPDDLGTHDGHTIDVGPVSCPACKRPYASAPTLTEEDREVMESIRDAWRRAAHVYTDKAADDVEWLCWLIDRLSGSTTTKEAHDA